MKVEPGNILKLFLNFSNFEPQYSYRLYSYKKECTIQIGGRNTNNLKTVVHLSKKRLIVTWVNNPKPALLKTLT